jgi:hypothetical protein
MPIYSANILLTQSTLQLYGYFKKALERASLENQDYYVRAPYAVSDSLNKIFGNNIRAKKVVSEYQEMSAIVERVSFGKVPEIVKIAYRVDEIRPYNTNLFYFIHHEIFDSSDENNHKEVMKLGLTRAAFIAALHAYNQSMSIPAPYKTAKYTKFAKPDLKILSLKDKKVCHVLDIIDLDNGSTQGYYNVTVQDPVYILKFFMTKIRAATSLESAMAFDKTYPLNKYFNTLKGSFSMRYRPTEPKYGK